MPRAVLLQNQPDERLGWLALMRGLCSLWIVYFHLFTPYLSAPFPKTNAGFFIGIEQRYAEMGLHWLPKSFGVVHDVVAAMSLHAVGLFILMSGFGITRSLLRRHGDGPVPWRAWFGERFLRLYPFLWLAHLIFLFAPFIWMPEPIDWRFVVSLTGVRAYPMDLMLFYANPAWWFFWLILQLYLVFPVLFFLLRRLGPVWFLVLTFGLTLLARYLILFVWRDGQGMIIGGFFASRLAEFTAGMVLAALWRRSPVRFGAALTDPRSLCVGLPLYVCGLLCYANLTTYLIVDFVTTCGLFLTLAPVMALVGRWSPARWALTMAASVSLSTFLLHQPWAITAGLALRGQPWWVFALCALAFLPLMVALASLCERALRALLDRLGLIGR